MLLIWTLERDDKRWGMGGPDHAVIPPDQRCGPACGPAYGGVPTALLGDLIARAGAAWVREASPSMSPLIRPGDEVRLVPLDSRRVRRGTLIAYQGDQGLILHRVLARTSAGLVAKGDTLACPDPLVGWEEVVACLAAVRRPGRPPADFTAFPWPVLNLALGVIASIATRLPVEQGSAGRTNTRGDGPGAPPGAPAEGTALHPTPGGPGAPPRAPPERAGVGPSPKIGDAELMALTTQGLSFVQIARLRGTGKVRL